MDRAILDKKFDIENLAIAAAIALFPFYVFESGGVQPTHIAFLLLAALTTMRFGIIREIWGYLIVLLSIYSFMVEATYGAFSNFGDLSYLLTPAFFLFNFILSVGVYQVVLWKGASVLRVGVIAAAAFAVISVYISGVDLQELSASGRTTGAFNNPNQLGYFSVCLLSLSYLLYQHGAVRFYTMLSLFAAAIFLAIASLSKAAIVANFIVLAFALRPQVKGYGLLLWLGLAVVLIGSFSYLLTIGYFDDLLFYNRIINMGNEQDSSLEARGYFAFLNGSWLQIVLGMGSPEVFWIVGHEVHSTFASIMNSYGLVGLSLFLAIFVIWWRTLNRAYGFFGTIVVMGPAILYGLSHNGTRFSIFWLLFSASMGLAVRERHLRKGRVGSSKAPSRHAASYAQSVD